MSRWSINDWNAKIDKTLTVTRLGKQGILYEYILPYGADPNHYYEEAIDVKSRKKSESNKTGRRLGTYQPIGDKHYFTFYQMKQIRKNGAEENYMQMIKEIVHKFYER